MGEDTIGLRGGYYGSHHEGVKIRDAHAAHRVMTGDKTITRLNRTTSIVCFAIVRI